MLGVRGTPPRPAAALDSGCYLPPGKPYAGSDRKLALADRMFSPKCAQIGTGAAGALATAAAAAAILRSAASAVQAGVLYLAVSPVNSRGCGLVRRV
jgi:hypothetical protein